MNVPFLDLSAQHARIRTPIDDAIGAVIDGTAFASGPFVAEFEEAFADYVGAKHCIGLNSGTTALHLALIAGDIGPGDEVVTTPHTWISTSWAISYCGAIPVYADVNPSTGNLAPEAAEAAITSRTKAILPVDLYGNPADHEAFEEIAARHGLLLIDDAAQAHGARLNERRIGSFGWATCFSFYPGKNLGAMGEGGAVVTDSDEIAHRVRSLRDHAQQGRHNHIEIGFNGRMDGLQGAVLTVKLNHLEQWNAERRVAADRYTQLLSGIEGVTLPALTQGATSSWHLYVVRVYDRDSLGITLGAEGVETGVHYPTPVHLQPAYAGLRHEPGAFPNAERYAATCLSLPMFPEITPGQQEYVVECIARALEAAA
jgi:dTDP-4-amino-4,6-dideoxygalactose transaminase